MLSNQAPHFIGGGKKDERVQVAVQGSKISRRGNTES